MTMDKIDRRSTWFVDLEFIDEDEESVIPTSATTKIHDRDTGTIIRAATPLADLASELTFLITEAENETITATEDREVHVLTIEFDYLSEYGTAHRTKEHPFMIENLEGVEASPSA
jgi:hypothetical protein